MLGDTDLTKPHEIEQLRRSVAMLRPDAWALKREDALRVLEELAHRVEGAR